MSRVGIKFDFTSVDIIAEEIENATLSFYRTGPYYYYKDGEKAGEPVPEHDQNSRITAHVLEQNFDFNVSDPDYYDLIAKYDSTTNIAAYDYVSGTVGWISFDVTDAVKNMVANSASNHGFILQNNMLNERLPESGIFSIFHSSEATDTTLRPKLSINDEAISISKNVTATKSGVKTYTLSVAQKTLKIKSSKQIRSIKIYDLKGTIIRNEKPNNTKSISIKGLGPAVYIAEITGKNSKQIDRFHIK